MCVHSTRVPLGGGCGSNWLTIVGLSTCSSKYPEHVLLLAADHRLAHSATLEICGHLQGASVVNLMNTLKTTFESKQDHFCVYGVISLPRTPLTIFFASLVQKYNELVLIGTGVTKCNFPICMAEGTPPINQSPPHLARLLCRTTRPCDDPTCEEGCTGVPRLQKKCNPLGPYRRPMPRVLGGS